MKISNLALLSGAIFCVVANGVFANPNGDSRSTNSDNFSVIRGSVISDAEQVDVEMEEYVQDNHPLENAETTYQEIKDNLIEYLNSNRETHMELSTVEINDIITNGKIESIALQILCELAQDLIEHQDIYSEYEELIQNYLKTNNSDEETKYWFGLLNYIYSIIVDNYINAINTDGEGVTDALNAKLEQASVLACNLWFEYQIEERLDIDFPEETNEIEDLSDEYINDLQLEMKEETKAPKQPKSLKTDKKAKKTTKK